jgi:hypothetical protein
LQYFFLEVALLQPGKSSSSRLPQNFLKIKQKKRFHELARLMQYFFLLHQHKPKGEENEKAMDDSSSNKRGSFVFVVRQQSHRTEQNENRER